MTRARRAWRPVLASLLAFATGAAGAVALTTDTRGLGAAEARASAAVVDDAVARLPHAWAAALEPSLDLDWRDDLPPRVDGHYRSGRITLRRQLLRDAVGGDERPALAALLHELAHAWDRSPTGALSRDPRLEDLAGWQVAPLRLPRTRNAFSDRSPDAYERASPSEFVAVNLEHVLLDPAYACRRPALYRWFAARAGLDASTATCAPPAFVRAGGDAAAEPSALVTLDPARVYAVDYLLAEPDTHPMSRWGHAMLRVVVCAPGRVPGPDCRQDVAYHEVLSFRAFVDDVRVSAWRGLVGGYPSRLFVLPMPRVIEEYTRVELRGLRAVPLRLSRAEIATLIDRAAQVHWSYDGRYRFVTANCAVETWRLLHDGVPRLADAPLSSLSPTGLLRRLEKLGFVDEVPSDPATAARLGYRFDASDRYFQALLDTARASTDIPTRRTRDWLALDPELRARAFDAADLRGTAALLVLENAALRRAERDAAAAFARVADRRGRRPDPTLQAAFDLGSRRAHPASWLPAGYGVPDADERARVDAALADAARRADALEGELRAAAMLVVPARVSRRLERTRANATRLGDRLRVLAAEAADATQHPGAMRDAAKAGSR